MDRELDAQIAERVMGWTNVYVNERGEMYAVTPESAPGRTRVNPFTTDLNACATAEARIISMGLGDRYPQHLAQEYPWRPGDTGAINLTLWTLTASAEARCRAMLATLEGK